LEEGWEEVKEVGLVVVREEGWEEVREVGWAVVSWVGGLAAGLAGGWGEVREAVSWVGGLEEGLAVAWPMADLHTGHNICEMYVHERYVKVAGLSNMGGCCAVH
jgi:hypothetical protein